MDNTIIMRRNAVNDISSAGTIASTVRPIMIRIANAVSPFLDLLPEANHPLVAPASDACVDADATAVSVFFDFAYTAVSSDKSVNMTNTSSTAIFFSRGVNIPPLSLAAGPEAQFHQDV